MTIDVIICTYNRPLKVMELVMQLQNCTPAPSTIIIVDSSDILNQDLFARKDVKYIQSNHKNQPYQRFLGTQFSDANYILFLDDDMEVVEKNVLGILTNKLKEDNIVGLALNFRDKHKDTTLSDVPKSQLFKFSNSIRKFKNWLTGYPELANGKLGLCGNRGKQHTQYGLTEYVSGGAFVAKRDALFHDFNFQLFDLFENKLGMGEDALIGYSLSKIGNVHFIPEIYFLHNDQRDSSYSLNIEAYSKRVLFSRLYLSLEKYRIDSKPLFLAYIHYHWYSIWRIFGQIINFLLKPTSQRKQVLKGSFNGWRISFNLRFKRNLERNSYWEKETKEIVKIED